MHMIWRVARSRWFRTLLGVLVLCVLVWFCGPLLGVGELRPLETEVARLAAIAVLLVLWLVSNLPGELAARRRDAKLAGDVVKPGPSADETASAEEVALLGTRLAEASRTLRRAGRAGGARRLATLPWYMFIGPPGAGKTTALRNCGLRFPLADEGGPQAVRGVGGTRDCDWWFTDEAVLIDTAGRYTTQDSNAAVDAAGWLGFLRALKRHRRRQPLNGVLVAISLSDLATLPDAGRQAHARAIRRRVRELYDELGARVPVYVVFTKADMIAGFVEFFDGLGREEREQVWGATFALDHGDPGSAAVGGFAAAFDALLARLNERMLERVNQESDVRRRRLIYGFPQQVASLRDVADEFLQAIFAPSRLESALLLRGAYLTSGTQDGTPIDRLVGQMAAAFGLPRQAAAAFSGTGRAYFLVRLLREVVFGEAALVRLDPKAERRARWLARGGWAASGLVLATLAATWTGSYFGNLALVDEVHAGTATYAGQYAALADASRLDLPPVVPPLDTLRGLRGGYRQRAAAIPVALTFGLYQGNKLSAAALDAYVRALDRLLLPRMLARLETQLGAHPDKPDVLYQLLKVYLTLGRQGKLDPELVMQWFRADLLAGFPGDDNAALRDSLAGHAEAMLEQPLEAVPLDDGLIARVRAILNREPLAAYSYNRILGSRRVRSLPAWSVAENGGPAAGRVFRMRSGAALDAGLPGAYTWAGYHEAFAPMLRLVAEDVAEDGWVLGRPRRSVAETVRDAGKLRHDVMELYLDDYTRRWDGFIADVAIRPFGSLGDGLDELSLLSAPASPLRDLLQAVDAQITLSRAGATDAAAAAAEQRAAKLGSRAAGFATIEARSGLSLKQNELMSIMAEAFGTDPSGKPVDPLRHVDDHFRALHEFVAGGENKPSALEALLQKLGTLYQSLNQIPQASSPGEAMIRVITAEAGAGEGGAGAMAQLAGLTHDLPPQVAGMLQPVAQSGTRVTATGASQELTNAWASKVVPLCAAVADRYPFAAGEADVPAEDFAHLLGPAGLVDQFFEQYLKPFVDLTRRPWAWQSAQGAPLGLSPGSLAMFERASRIRDALFRSPAMAVRFELVPGAVDPQLARVSLDVGDQTLSYSQGPRTAKQFQWPDAGGKTIARVTMTPANGGQDSVTEEPGPWALLRLLDTAKVSPTAQPDRFHVVFSGAGGTAAFELNASSTRNPFGGDLLRGFRCPAKL